MYRRPDMITPGVDPQGQPLDPRKIQDHFELQLHHSMRGRPIIVDFSLVTDFREATCRQYEENVCDRGGYCNFMHLKKISRELRRQLFGRSRRRQSRSQSRRRSPQRHRNYDEHPHGGGGGYGRRGDYADHRQNDRGRRPRSRSPGRRGGRSRSPGGKRNRSPAREGSAEKGKT